MTQDFSRKHPFAIFCLCLFAVLLALFHESLDPSKVLFSNDGPLGAMSQKAIQLPAAFTGVWYDLNSIGASGGTFLPNFTQGLFCVLGPVYWAKFGAIFHILMSGLGAWFFFRQSKLAPIACLAGGLAATLNSDFFSTACWGVGAQTLCFGLTFLGLGILQMKVPRLPWLKFALAGLLVGLGVTEAFDIGAIFSVLFAGFVFYSAVVAEGPPMRKLATGVGRVALIAAFAAFMAAQGLNVLISTSIKGIAGTAQDAQTKAAQWGFATQWSLPKLETLSLIAPGLFGYRLDTPDGGNYWGHVGRDAAWDEYFRTGAQGQPPDPRGHFIRHTGGGIYQGISVALVAAFAAVQALRRRDSIFNLAERKLLWFWMGVVVISLLLAFGRHGVLYRLFYALPYVSAIRNPAKFCHVLSFATVVLFAYGVNGLWRHYMERAATSTLGFADRLKSWWPRASLIEKRWVKGCAIAIGASLVGWLILSSSKPSLEQYLQKVLFEPAMAKEIASFSIRQVGWFLFFFILAAGLLTLILSGAFGGAKARLGAILLALLVVVDLGRANLRWPIFWDYKDKYASNEVLDLLREKPFEHRVTMLPDYFRVPDPQLAQAESLLSQLYSIEWVQQQFQFYNIQSVDVVQMPRAQSDLENYQKTLMSRPGRYWQLTNTRYLLAAYPFIEALKQNFDPGQGRFRILTRFNLAPKPGVVNATRLQDFAATLDPNGIFAIFEFAGALPRATLFNRWEVCADESAAVANLRTNLLGSGEREYLNAADANDLLVKSNAAWTEARGNLKPTDLERLKATVAEASVARSNAMSSKAEASLKSIGTNDFLTLRKLASPEFDPWGSVLLADHPMKVKNASGTNGNPGTVEFVSYEPKHIVLHAKSAGPSILLLNDKFDPTWKVTVDGKPETLLRCNYIMRGVEVADGAHTVEFRFEPPISGFYISLAAIIVGLALAGILIIPGKTAPAPANEPARPQSKPAAVTAKK